MSERDFEFYFESILGLLIFDLFFIFALLGTFLGSLNSDSFLYVKYDPEIDVIVIMMLIMMDLFFVFYLLNILFKFRQSRNLNYRKGELMALKDKIKLMSFFYFPQKAIKVYFLIKYFYTSLTFYMFLLLIIEISLISLILIFSFILSR